MSSTTVRSENNQMKTEVTGMGIVFNTRENKYEIEVGQTLDTVLKDHIQAQGEMGISVENGYVEKRECPDFMLKTNEKTIGVEITKIYAGNDWVAEKLNDDIKTYNIDKKDIPGYIEYKKFESKIKTYAFVGPSGTGKSYRAQMVASERGISYIIDDGLLIKENEVIAGVSAKKAATKIETVKKALFNNQDEADEIKKAFRKYRPESILILGTSDNMIKKIRENLGLPELTETIYISDVATEEEMQEAKRIRQTQGKHVIPVPTFEIKKDFSGFILDPLQIFKSKGKDAKPYISEKSIIRPTFSYLGKFVISDTVFRQIIEYLVMKTEGLYKASRVRIDKIGENEGVSIYIEVVVEYGFNIVNTLKEFKKKCKKEIENLTAMNVENVDIIAKGIHVSEEIKGE